MKNLLLKRILPFMMAMIMLVSFCLPVGAFSFSSSENDDEAAYYSIKLEDGILRVVLNPQKLYNLLRDGDFSKEDLKQFIPEEVLNTLSGSPSADDLLALASEYLSKEDVESILNLIPKEILTKHFLNIGFLESLITLDEMISVISIDELLADIENQDKFNSDLNELLTPYLDQLMTETVINNLMSNTAFLETILADAIDNILADEEQRKVVMDALPKLVTDDVINAILGNDAYKNALTQMIIANDAVLAKIQDDPATIDKLAAYLSENPDIAEKLMADEAMIDDLKDHPDWLINETVVKYMFAENKLTPAILHEVFGDDVINGMVTDDVIEELMKSDVLISSVVASAGFASIANKLMTDELFKLALNEIDITNYITFSDDFASKFNITAESLVTKGYVSLEEIASAFGITAKDLIDKGCVSLNDIAVAFGITAEDLIDKGCVSLNDIADAFGITAKDLIDKGCVSLNDIATAFGITAEDLVDKGCIVFDVTFANAFGIDPSTLVEASFITFDADFATYLGITPENLEEYGHVDSMDIYQAGLVNPTLADLIDADLIDVSAIMADARYGITIQKVLAYDALDLDTKAIVDYYGITPEAVFNKDLVNAEEILAKYPGVTPEAVFNKGLVDAEEILAKYPGVTPEAVFNKGLVDAEEILAAYPNITPEAIFDKGLVDLSGIVNDPAYNITLDKLGLTNAQLQEIATTLLANPGTKTALMNTFTAKVKAGEILPSQFIDCIDFKALALENNGIDLVGMVENLLTNDENADEHLDALFSKITLTDDDMKNIMNEMGQDACMDIVKEHFSEILEDLGGPDAILKHFSDKMALVDALFGTETTPGFIALITPDSETGVALVSFDDIAIALGGVENPNASNDTKKNAGFGILISMLDTAAVANELSELLLQYVSFAQIVEAMGGFNQVMTWYEPDFLVSIAQDIGTDRLIQFAQDNGILTTETVKSIATDIAKEILNDKDRLKAFVANAKSSVLQIILEEVNALSLNGIEFFKNGRFDLQTLVYAILSAIPDVEAFCEMEEGDSIFSLIFKATYHSADVPTILGIDVSFEGDFTKLQTLASYHKDLFRFDVTEDLDMTVSSELPRVIARLYAKVLESDKLPAVLKGTLLMAPTTSIADMADLLESFTDEELNALADAVNDKLDEVLPDAIAKGEALIDRIPEGLIDKAGNIQTDVLAKLPDGTLDRVTSALIKLRTAEGMRAALNKAAATLRNLPINVQSLSVDRFYTRDGNFTMDPVAFAIDPMNQNPLMSKLPAKLQNLAQSILSGIPDGLIDLSISASLAASVTVQGVYRLTLVDDERNETVFFLPEGTDLSVLSSVYRLDLSIWGENLPESMPGHDTVVHIPLKNDDAELIFIYHEPVSPFRAVEYDRIRYTWGDTTLSVTPKTPPTFRGYTAKVPNYLAEMNIETTREIHVFYTANEYNLTFNRFDGTNVVIPFGIDSSLVIGESSITLNGTTLPELTATDDKYGFAWVKGDKTYASTRAFAEELAELLSDPFATLSNITLVETRVAKEYTLTFLDANGEIYDEVVYTIDSDIATLMGQIPNVPTHADAGYYYEWMLVENNGVAVDPATKWNKNDFAASLRAGALANLTIQATEALEIYTYTFVYLTENNRGSVVVPYTVETTREEFAGLVPGATEKRGYTYYWTTAAGALWSTALFAEHDADALGDYTVYEAGGIDTYVFTITLLDGTVVTVDYNIEAAVNELRTYFAELLPEDTRAYTYKWQRYVEAPAARGLALLADAPEGMWVDWDPETFTMDDLGNLTLRQAETPVEYSFTIHKLDGAVATVPYTIETSKDDLMAALLAERNTDTNGYTYTWEIKNGEAWSAWSETEVDPANVQYLDNYEIRIVQTANTYTITFDMAQGADKTVTYTIETLMEEFTVPAHTESRAYAYEWQKNGVAWTLATLFGEDGILSEEELASYTVVEEGTAIPYTLTFQYLNGDTETVTYTIETTYAEFLAMIPALGAPADSRTHERFWKANGAEWTAAKLYGANETLEVAELATYTVAEQERLIVYTITFEMSNGSVVLVKYNADGYLTGYNQFPTLTAGSKAYSYKWQRDGADWDLASFTITEYASFTVVELKSAIDYVWTFTPWGGTPVTVIVNMDRTGAEIKAEIDALAHTDAEKVYSYNWYRYTNNIWQKLSITSRWTVSDSDLETREYTEIRTINDNNYISFLTKDGVEIVKYYYDKENFYIREGDFTEIPVDGNVLPVAPSISGYEFVCWTFSGSTQIRPDGTVFDVNTFRDYVDYGTSRKARIKVLASYDAIEYKLYFHMLDGNVLEIPYTVESNKNALSIPELISNKAFDAYWTLNAVGGSRWSIEAFHPETALRDFHIYENSDLREYVVTFVRANGTRTNVLLTFITTRSQFLSQMPEQISNAAFERTWLYNGAAWSIDDLYTNGEAIDINMLNDYRIEEKEVAHAFMLTFKDLDGNLITQVIYNGYGPLYGKIPTLPSSEDGYLYSWYNVTEDAAWGGFDAMACKNLELRLTRKAIVYNLTFIMKETDTVLSTATYSVEDHSFVLPTIAPRAGYEQIWFYMEGETVRYWAREDLTVGDLVLYADFTPLKYSIIFHAENGTEYYFTMTVESKGNPSVPPKAGYSGVWYVQLGNEPADTDPKWTDYNLADGGLNVNVYVKYTALPYYIDFMVDGAFFSSGTYVIGGDWTPPTPPERPGYTAEWYIQVDETWIKWSEYDLEFGSSKLIAKIVYTPIVYTAKFFADGKLVGTTNFTVEDSALAKIPAVPTKAGFTGVWSEYKIGPGDLEIHAIYTAIEEPAHPLEGKDFLISIDGFVGGLYEGDVDGLHWIWWLIILILFILIVLTLILLLVIFKRKKKETPPEEPDAEPEPEDVPEPENEEPVEEEPELEEEILDTVDVETADEMMSDVTALAAIETVGGAKAAGLKSIINISKINDAFNADDTVDAETLKAKKLIPAKTERLKVLGDGHLDKPLTVVADSFSIQAVKMITLTGGKAIQKKADK